jgi:hypothetical protein
MNLNYFRGYFDLPRNKKQMVQENVSVRTISPLFTHTHTHNIIDLLWEEKVKDLFRV